MMETLIASLASLRPGSMGPIALLMLVGGAAAMAWPLMSARNGRGEMKRRLKLEMDAPAVSAEPAPKKKNANVVREKAAKTAQDFYARSDPENVARLRLRSSISAARSGRSRERGQR